MRRFPAAVLLILGVMGCADTAGDSSPGDTAGSAVPTSASVVTTSAPASEVPTADATVPPTTEPEQCLTLRYENYAQVELVSPQGTRVLIDVGDPSRLSSPPTADDILLTTHTHWDHYEESFQTSFPGQQLFIREGTLDAPGVHVDGIASVHRSTQRPLPEGGYNYLYIIDVAGLRVAHFGDIGQDDLTPEQLSVLGTVDVAISQLANPYSDMDAANLKGFHLMQQLAPRLLIPTHVDRATASRLPGYWPGAQAVGSPLTICPSGLPATTEYLLLGDNATQFAANLQLPVLTPTDCVCAEP